jgi:glycogen(starch) synthase
MDPRRFTVALSYPGERRGFVSQVAGYLAGTIPKSKILYDKYHEAAFARPNLDQYLPKLYKDQSELIVIFLCDEYAAKRWCKLEWRYIRQLIQTQDENRIMLLSFDELAEDPDLGILPGDGYAFIGDRPAEEIGALILERLDQIRSTEPESAPVAPSRSGSTPGKALSRVCFVSSEYPPNVRGGLGVHVHQLTLALSKHLDVDVVLASPGSKKYQKFSPRIHLQSLRSDNPSYAERTSWFSFANNAADKIVRLKRDNRPDVIHCHDWVTVLAGIKCRFLLNIPLVFHVHLPNRHQLCSMVENLGLVCADLVTVNSQTMYEELNNRRLNNRRLPIKRLEVVKNGVDTNEFTPCDDWPADDSYILFVGRLVEQKGVEYLLRALSSAKERFPNVRLKIVGDGEFRPMLERIATNLMLGTQVEFLGWQTGSDLVKCYQKAQIVVIPSIYEPFGMTALEAMACQRPVVASRVGGLSEIIEHEVTGFLAEPKDDLDLAQWIMTLLSSAEMRNEMGKAGRNEILTAGYTWPQIAERFIEFYKDLLKSPISANIPDRAAEIKARIEDLAKKEADADADVLEQLFNWKS